MAVWEQTEDSLADLLLSAVVRFCATVGILAVVIGPVVAGAWAANAYIEYRTTEDHLRLPVSKTKLPSPQDLIGKQVSDLNF